MAAGINDRWAMGDPDDRPDTVAELLAQRDDDDFEDAVSQELEEETRTQELPSGQTETHEPRGQSEQALQAPVRTRIRGQVVRAGDQETTGQARTEPTPQEMIMRLEQRMNNDAELNNIRIEKLSTALARERTTTQNLGRQLELERGILHSALRQLESHSNLLQGTPRTGGLFPFATNAPLPGTTARSDAQSLPPSTTAPRYSVARARSEAVTSEAGLLSGEMETGQTRTTLGLTRPSSPDLGGMAVSAVAASMAAPTTSRSHPWPSYGQVAGSTASWPQASLPQAMEVDHHFVGTQASGQVPMGRNGAPWAPRGGHPWATSDATDFERQVEYQASTPPVPVISERSTQAQFRGPTLSGPNFPMSRPGDTGADVNASLPGPFIFRANNVHPSPLPASFATVARTPNNFKVPAPEKFSGTDNKQDIESWIMQVRRYIRVSNIADDIKVDVAASCLSGPAAKAWFAAEQQLQRAGHDTSDLEVFFYTMQKDYGQMFQEQKVRQQLRNFKQQKSVEQYSRAFRSKVWQLKDSPMAEADQVEYFLQGLKEPIRKECAWNPGSGTPFRTLHSLIEYAVAFENSQNRNNSSSNDMDIDQDQGKPNKGPAKQNSSWQKGDNNNNNNNSTYHKQAGQGQAGQKRKWNSQADQSGVQKQPRVREEWEAPAYYGRVKQYLKDEGLCFHCGSHAHDIRNCEDRLAHRPYTRIVVPSGWIAKCDRPDYRRN